MSKWECPCGFVYIEGKTPPGDKFEELPEDYVCPVCGAAKDIFYKLSDE